MATVPPTSTIPPTLLPTPFPSHHTAPDLSPQIVLLCETLISSTPQDLETRLAATKIQPEPEIVQQVLKLSYNSPSASAKFFRWAGLSSKHTGYSWNLMVDLLGKNKLFEPMWDAIRSMNKEGLLSLTTFVSVFENYCVAGRFDEAIMTFDVMERYGIQPDTVAVNSLLSAICREQNQTSKALEFFEKIKSKIPPDPDSFAILLEGWEKEGNVAKAKNTFGEMVIRVGWSQQHTFAYDAFLNTLVCGSQADEAIKFLTVMKGKNCLPGLRFFSNALDIFAKRADPSHAIMLWDLIVGNGWVPDLKMYNAVIASLTSTAQNVQNLQTALRLLDGMPFNGVFADSSTYNMIFECLIKGKKVRETGKFFLEMVKNEWVPTAANFAGAVRVLFEGDDPEMAVEVWKYMVENNISPRDESANEVLIGFCNMGRLTDLRRFAEKMIDEKIIIYETTMTKAKIVFYKEGKSVRDLYDNLLRKWKSSYL